MSEEKFGAPFQLAPLPYAYDALEPVISAETMRLHHDKHHHSYIDALNKVLEGHPEWHGKTIEQILSYLDEVPEAVRQAVRNQGGGHANHQLFWKIMKPNGGGEPGKDLAEAIRADFGSGWVFLVVDPAQGGKLDILTMPNQDSVLLVKKPALLGNDLWEHAYYLQYQNRRADYLKAWWERGGVGCGGVPSASNTRREKRTARRPASQHQFRWRAGTMSASVQLLIVVDSWQGHTANVAEKVIEGVQAEGGYDILRSADEATRADVQAADALIMGSAVHQRAMTWKMKRFVDKVCEPAWFYDDLVGRVGAVFTAGGGHGQNGGGAESAQLGMLANLAACGMVLVSLPKNTPGFEHAGIHWGPTIKATDANMQPLEPGALDKEAREAFFHHGANVVRVAQRLKGIELATGNRWPSPEDRQRRADAERHRPLDRRLPHPADSASV